MPTFPLRVAVVVALAGISAGSIELHAVSQAPTGIGCTMDLRNSDWVRTALANWDAVRREDLHIADAPLPWIILFDASCAWHLRPESPAWSGERHDGHVRLPNDETIDVKVLSFAGTYGPEDRPFMVMALPISGAAIPGTHRSRGWTCSPARCSSTK